MRRQTGRGTGSIFSSTAGGGFANYRSKAARRNCSTRVAIPNATTTTAFPTTRFAISDQTGDGKSRVYVLPISGGKPRLMTKLAPSYWHGWSPDGKTLAYCAERNGEFVLGIDPAKFIGTAEEFFKAVHPEDREMINAALARTIEQNVPYETEYRAVWPDGSLHYIIARAKLFRDETGRPVRVNGLIWDITGRKQMEDEVRKGRDELELRVRERTTKLGQAVARLESMNEELQEFAFIASHDLQEPLRKIQTFGNMLTRKHKESLNPEGQDFMERMTKAANRMSELLRLLLKLLQNRYSL